MQHTRHVKAQHIAHFQTQGFGNAFFNAHRAGGLWLPCALHHLVVLRGLCTVRQIEFAIDQTLRTFFCVMFGQHRFTIDGHQATSDHGVPIELLHMRLFQSLQKRIGLRRLNVDDKTVGRIGRCGVAPAADQIGSQQHQQSQG